MCLGQGTGTILSSVINDLENTAVLLVNPRVPLATGPVFAGWDGKDGGALPEGPASRIAEQGRNDLEAPAIAHAPQIADVLSALREGSNIARMSGSGASCFALYDDTQARDVAASRIAQAHPEWWQMSGKLRA